MSRVMLDATLYNSVPSDLGCVTKHVTKNPGTGGGSFAVRVRGTGPEGDDYTVVKRRLRKTRYATM
jgi:hypothetical protein